MRDTTVAQLRDVLATADGRDEVEIYADVTGERVDIPPYHEKVAVVCGYFSVDSVRREAGVTVIRMGAESTL